MGHEVRLSHVKMEVNMIETITLEVPSLVSQWGLSAKQWQKIKDVFLVETEYGRKNLKVSPLCPERLIFVHHAVEHLTSHGFSKMAPLIPTPEGKTYITAHNYAFSLFDWIEGRQCDFQNRDELAESTRVLAEFHQYSAGFTPPKGSNMRDQLGKCLKHFEERYQNLIDFKEAAKSDPGNEFSRIYLDNVDFFLPMAETAITKLKKSDYRQLVELAKKDGKFCHGDPAARNFILTPHHQIRLIDFDSCRLDLPIMDVIKFTRRVMKKHNWSFAVAKLIMDSYQEVVRFSPSELEVMRAVFYFPQKFWRMAIRHFHKHNRHTMERSIHKFRKYLKNRNEMALFLEAFSKYQTN